MQLLLVPGPSSAMPRTTSSCRAPLDLFMPASSSSAMPCSSWPIANTARRLQGAGGVVSDELRTVSVTRASIAGSTRWADDVDGVQRPGGEDAGAEKDSSGEELVFSSIYSKHFWTVDTRALRLGPDGRDLALHYVRALGPEGSQSKTVSDGIVCGQDGRARGSSSVSKMRSRDNTAGA